jgi:hypothetical protein
MYFGADLNFGVSILRRHDIDTQPLSFRSYSASSLPRLTDDLYSTCLVIMAYQAYQDPYAAGQFGGGHYAQPQYGQQQYGNQQQPQYGQYGDPAPEFNPYGSDHAHTYEPGAYDHYGAGGGYRDDPEPPQRQASHGYSDAPPAPPLKALDERSAFDAGEFTPGPRGPK